jgi:hypothetical protein
VPFIYTFFTFHHEKGRLRLLGRCASARNMIAKLLVNGTSNHNSISGKEGSQEGEASTSSSICSDIPVDGTTPYELEGRGWQVVNVTAFESLVKGVGLNIPHWIPRQVGVTHWIPWQIEQTMLYGNYSHIIYIEESGSLKQRN